MTVESKEAIVEDPAKDTSIVSATPEKKEEEVKTIPYDRFAEVNQKMKEYEAQAKEFEKFKQEQERKKLESKGKYEEILTQIQTEFEEYKKSVESEKFNYQKDSILSKYNIDESKKRFITWNSLEEIEESAKLFSEMVLSSKQKEQEEEKKENLDWRPKIDNNNENLDWWVFFTK